MMHGRLDSFFKLCYTPTKTRNFINKMNSYLCPAFRWQLYHTYPIMNHWWSNRHLHITIRAVNAVSLITVGPAHLRGFVSSSNLKCLFPVSPRCPSVKVNTLSHRPLWVQLSLLLLPVRTPRSIRVLCVWLRILVNILWSIYH